MKFIKSKFFITIAIGFTLLATLLGGSLVKCFAANGTKYVGELTFDRFDLGTTIKIKNTDKLSSDGELFDINTAILQYPSGLNINSKSFNLDQYGEYKIILKHNDNIYCTESFRVNGACLTSSNPNTKIEYGSLNKQFGEKGFYEGLSIKASEGDFIKFAEPINVYENNITKLIYFNLVQMDQKVKNIDIRITDCYDPNLYLDILYKRGNKEILTYVSASAMGQRDFGLDKSQNGTVVLDNENYVVSTFDGTIMDSNNPTSGNYNNFMFYLDTSNRDRIRVIAETDIVYKKCIITEFNNPSIYSYNFPGFTNGNVYLSISANNFENVESANIEIAQACGLEGSELKELINNNYNDDNAPIFNSSLNERVHNIRCGSEFIIPTIEALDDTGIKGNVDYSVWYNYDSNARCMVSTHDGKFTPKNLGFYTIVYRATDYFGNVGEYRVDLVATSVGEEGISFKFEGLGNITAGKQYLLNKYTVESLNGEVNVSIQVTDPKGNSEILSKPDEKYKVKYVGKYNLKYIYTDQFYQGEYSTSFVSLGDSKPSFDKEEITSSLYYIKGAEYSIDYISAYTYSVNEPIKANVKSYVSFDGGNFVECDRQRIVINGNSSVQFKYIANDDETSAIFSETAKIVDVNYSGSQLNLGAYFDSSVFTDKSSDDSGLNLKATTSGIVDTINFVNKLYLSAFSVSVSVPSSSKFSEFSLILSDYYNHSNFIKVTFGSIDGVSQYISINNEPFKYVDLNWKDCDIEIKYSSETTLTVGLTKTNEESQKLSYSYVLNNRISLSNEYLLMAFDIKDIQSNDVFTINSLMKQKFDKYVTEDENSPIAMIDYIETVQDLNTIVKIPSFYYVDVLSPSSELNAKLTVKQLTSESRILKSTSGVLLNSVTNLYDEFEVLLDKFGTYQFLFDYVDGANNKIKTTEAARIRPIISVIDEEPPTISLDGSSQKAKINEKITPIKATVSDNCSSGENISIYYFVYSNQNVFVTSCKNGEQFSVSSKGDYTVYVYCTDENGNYAYLTYKLVIEE